VSILSRCLDHGSYSSPPKRSSRGVSRHWRYELLNYPNVGLTRFVPSLVKS